MSLTCFYPTLASSWAVTLLCTSTLALAACGTRASAAPEPPAAAKATGMKVKAIGAYVFLKGREDRSMFIVSSGGHIDSTESLRARFGSSFLWFLHEKKPYLIQDEALLAKASDLFRGDPVLEEADRRLEAQEAKLEGQQNGLEARREALENKLERLDAQEEAQEDGRGATAEQRAAVDRDRQAIDRDMLALDKEAQTLDRAMEKLNTEREALSEKQEKLMEAGELQLQKLMLEALKSGLARPVADKMKAS